MRHPRDRILLATARLVRARGYLSLTVDELVEAAGVTRASFYAHFQGKEAAFLGAQLLSLRESIALAAAGFALGRTWPDRVWAGLAELLAYTAANPALTHLTLLGPGVVGAPALRRDRDNRMAYALFLSDGRVLRNLDAAAHSLFAEAVGGAIQALMRRQLRRGRTATMLEILPPLPTWPWRPFSAPRPRWSTSSGK